MKIINLLIGVILALTMWSCDDNEGGLPLQVSQYLALDYAVGVEALEFDTIRYTNAAGNDFSVNRLEFYISNVTLLNGTDTVYTSPEIFYVNARLPATNTLELDAVPTGSYTAIAFHLGLDQAHNLSYSLPNTPENIDMAWPAMMGGGYHFLKLEGHYRSGVDALGYAVHLGTNNCLVHCEIPGAFEVSEANAAITLEMDLNQWYDDPYTYNLETDGSYTMGDSANMKLISLNGHNIFSLK